MKTPSALARLCSASLSSSGPPRPSPSDLHRTGRPVAKACLDRTERRTHLAGAAGAHLCRSLLDVDLDAATT